MLTSCTKYSTYNSASASSSSRRTVHWVKIEHVPWAMIFIENSGSTWSTLRLAYICILVTGVLEQLHNLYGGVSHDALDTPP